ncbi:MAG: LysM peptidoglycan-binding domain-containing protein [Patescibacteria group bacterium]|jgi:LysM repeat protein
MKGKIRWLARACADLLSDLYKATKDWNLALSGYNGGFIWEYLKESKKEEAEVSYKGFLKFIENKLNSAKDDVKAANSYTRIIKRGENLDAIAAEHGLKTAELAGYNKIGNLKNIKAGQKIAIPLRQAEKQAIFNKKISGFSENLNYPAKYYAVMELIREGLTEEQEKPITFEIKEVKQSAPSHNTYIAKAGDKNLFRISKALRIDYKELAKFNPEAVKNLKVGMKLKITNDKSRQVTLADVARQTNKSIARLEFLNPAVRKNAPIIINQIRV